MRRLLIYSQDGTGLGHLRRTSTVARECLAREPDCAVLVVADSPATPAFDLIPGVDHIKLPTIVKIDKSQWRPGTLPMAVGDVVALRAKLIVQAYLSFEPDTVLVDHMPVGALGELKPMLDLVRSSNPRPQLFLGLRDVLDDPAVIREVWTKVGAYDYLAQYDAVLVFGCQDIYDADAAYGLRRSAGEVVFCNYALRPLPAPPASGGEGFLLVTGGGGGADAFALEQTFLDALPRIPHALGGRAVILTGPNMPPDNRARLSARAAPYGVRVESGLQDSTDLFLRASAVLTMGGYNTLCEVLGARKPALVVPRAGPSAEQRMRSRLFAERNLVRMLDPSDLAPGALADALSHLLEAGGVPDEGSVPPLDGTRRASERMCGRPGPTRPRFRPTRRADAREAA
jgi:predicted glycosyltransferase